MTRRAKFKGSTINFKADRTGSYLPYLIFIERSFKMFFRCILLGTSLTIILFIFDVIVPKLIKKYKLKINDMNRKKKFKRTLKELEII